MQVGVVKDARKNNISSPYAQTLIVVVLIVVTFRGFLVITRHQS